MAGMRDSPASSTAEATFLSAISDKPESFLHPSNALHTSTLVVAKSLLDPVANITGVFDQLYTEGIHIEQIWQQIKSISEAVVDEVLDLELPEAKVANAANGNGSAVHEDDSAEDILSEEEEIELPSDSDIDVDLEEEDGAGSADDASDMMEEDPESSEGLEEDDDIEDNLEQNSIDSEDGDEFEENVEDGTSDEALPTEPIVKDVFGLNDQFFDIDEFNRQTEIMDANYAQEQSEDDIDYNADPDEASDADDLEQEMDDEENANEIRYEDFFAPPRNSRQSSDARPRKRTRFADEENDTTQAFTANEHSEEEDEDGALEDESGAQTIGRLQKDLFADEESASDEEPGQKLSTHAKRQLRLAEEIRQLENDNVAKKDWTLMGEASARARPKDSLLEDGMDFERTSRPVPIVTEEVTKTLEDMIRGRIAEGRFDTVTRKIPDAVHKFTKPSFELDENKPSQSLAEEYEIAIQKQRNPGQFKTAKDLKIEAEHREIEEFYKNICYNLDSLSSWHYTPKPVTESLSIVTNAPAIEMEDAQPLTMSSASRLAPQEQYNVSAEKGEVTGKSGIPISKAEMTSEERQRHRRKRRAAAKKSAPQKMVQYANMSKSKQEQSDVIDTLKRANVKVIRNGKTKDLKTGRDYTKGGTSLKSSTLKL